MTNFVIGAVLRHHLRFDFYQHQQLTEAWHIPPHVPTTSRRVGIMGLGRLGGAAAEDLARLGFQVAGWTRQRRVDIQEVNCYTGEAGLSEFLARTDILVCMLPLTPATRHIVNGKLLSSLPKGAAFINVGRGAQVIEGDLLGALNEHLSGATLDVFEQEPLPASHAFWKHPKVFITPHVATRVNPYSAAPSVVANYNRIKTGEAFTNLVDEVRGY
jgi:glyoxylate/hydroxypyruvate reductase A